MSIKTKDFDQKGVKVTLTNALAKATFLRNTFSTRLDIKNSDSDIQIGYSNNRGTQRETKDISTLYRQSHPWQVDQRSDHTIDHQRIYGQFSSKLSKKSVLSVYSELNSSPSNTTVNSTNGFPALERLQENDSIFSFQSNSRTQARNFFVQSSYQLSWDSTTQNLKLQVEYFKNNKSFTNTRTIDFFVRSQESQTRSYLDIFPQKLGTVVGTIHYSRNIGNGEFLSGIRFFKNQLNDQNEIFLTNEKNLLASSRFNYDEHTYAVFSEWSKEVKNVYYRLGLRLENNQIISKNVTTGAKSNLNWTNLFPSFLIQWNSSPANVWSLSYKNTFTRPDYYQLNPFERFTDNSVANFRGNQSIKPQKDYVLDLSWSNNSFFTSSVGFQYLKDFISTIVLPDHQGSLYQQYDNFNAQAYYANFNVSLNPLKPLKIIGSSNVIYYNAQYTKVAKEASTPLVDFRLLTAFSLKNKWVAQVNFYYMNTMSDGFFKHFNYSSVNLALQKKLDKPNVTFTLFFTDVF
ncbi:hypothetical protein BWI97_25560 [Siphonobacter sp. BAB-5405]|uniref:outer membrane beta-barrel family protein n=1 Tax=Siphonobacter sp. BAB-5405 TaxID=1864825 RepID=UPI000C7FBEAC|nr:outer membrane beta-barrel family protein [Siphonobacter sp. BAB-5405]PMD87955.1 hypothetical protein BWI97_25560 [Siphonobacter sp. BAB-5405]